MVTRPTSGNERLQDFDFCRSTPGELIQIITDQQRTIAELRGLLEALHHDSSIMERSTLTFDQMIFLSSLLALPGDAFNDAQNLLKAITGNVFTQAFAISFTKILREKKWGVQCSNPECQKPAIILWHKNRKCKEGGSAEYSHTGTAHGGMTKIPLFTFLNKPDRRRRST